MPACNKSDFESARITSCFTLGGDQAGSNLTSRIPSSMADDTTTIDTTLAVTCEQSPRAVNSLPTSANLRSLALLRERASLLLVSSKRTRVLTRGCRDE